MSGLFCHGLGGAFHRCDSPPELVECSHNGGKSWLPYAWCKAAQRETRELAEREGEPTDIRPQTCVLCGGPLERNVCATLCRRADSVPAILGERELVNFTNRDGSLSKRWVRPVLDEHGGWLAWRDAGAE